MCILLLDYLSKVAYNIITKPDLDKSDCSQIIYSAKYQYQETNPKPVNENSSFVFTLQSKKK